MLQIFPPEIMEDSVEYDTIHIKIGCKIIYWFLLLFVCGTLMALSVVKVDITAHKVAV